MRAVLALALAMSVAACAPASKGADAALAEADYTLERKPTPGDPASARIWDDRIELSVFGPDGSISQAAFLVNPGAAPPPGLVEALGLAGEGWSLHPLTLETKAAGDANGLCAAGAPEFLLMRTDGQGGVTLAGYRGQNATEPDPTLLCETLRFLP